MVLEDLVTGKLPASLAEQGARAYKERNLYIAALHSRLVSVVLLSIPQD